MQTITVLGATGSIGVSTLDVLRRHPDRFKVFALTAHSSVEVLAGQCLEFQPRYAVVGDEQSAQRLRSLLAEKKLNTEVLFGREALSDVAESDVVNCVMAAIVGGAGLQPTMAAVRAGKRVLLANKEALVMGGALFQNAVRECNAELLPIDSEHNAIFQCLPAGFDSLEGAGISKILLTGSGGPFRQLPLDQFAAITPAQAVAHPNWSMGQKISVDSATMMNKGLEFIEACWLFNASPEQIDVIIHPQSIVHSMVQYSDGSVLAQLGQPDMRTPIAHCLGWPERIESGVEALDFTQLSDLQFESPDLSRFPCLGLAMAAMSAGKDIAAALNAANEVAVAAFLAGQISFPAIAEVSDSVLNSWDASEPLQLDDVIDADLKARSNAEQVIQRRNI